MRNDAHQDQSFPLSPRHCVASPCLLARSLEDLMRIRNVFASFLIAFVLFTLVGRSAAQSTWAVEKTFHIGGEGGMDYITLDAKNHRLYVPRSTHTMVIDADSGKTIADRS